MNIVDPGVLEGSRILIVGASGWIGRAVQQVLGAYRCNVMPLDSTASLLQLGAGRGDRQILAFDPTIAIFLAGVTPDRARRMGLTAYLSELDGVTATLEGVLRLPNLSQVCYASSGVVSLNLEFEDDPIRYRYRSAKLREECLVESRLTEREPLIVRVFSLSGPYVRRPGNFALFDFIEQSRTGTITVRSERLVYRSYSFVLDLADVLVSSLTNRLSGTYPTGGHCVELADLAQEVASVAQHPVRIDIPQQRLQPDVYCGNDYAWSQWCAASGVTPLGLRDQVIASAQWLAQRHG